MPELKYESHLTDAELGAAFRAATQLHAIQELVGNTAPTVGHLFANVDLQAAQRFPKILEMEHRQGEVRALEDAVSAVKLSLEPLWAWLQAGAVDKLLDPSRVVTVEDVLHDGETRETVGGGICRVSQAEALGEKHQTVSMGGAITLIGAVMQAILDEVADNRG